MTKIQKNEVTKMKRNRHIPKESNIIDPNLDPHNTAKRILERLEI